MGGRLGFGLSRELWIVEIGVFVNMLGYGAVLPFEIIYLHDGRGFALRTAGLVIGVVTGVAVVAAPLAGALIDRIGARAVAAGAGAALAAGYAGLALAHSPGPAFAAAACAGAGNGALIPSQSTLLATLAPPHLRHRASAVSRVAVNAGLGFGGALGGLVAAYGLTGFVGLFVLNALTYVVYVCVLVAVVRGDGGREPVAGGYRVVLRDGPFVRLVLTNVAMIAVGWGVLAYVVPPYARGDLGTSARLIGLLLLANAATVVVAQMPIVRLAEGRRRVAMLALAAAIWVVAPAGLRGRYMAAIGLSWSAGLALAPTLGTQLLSVSPAAALLGAAAVAAAAGAAALTLEPALPEASRLTPRPRGGYRARPDG